MGKPKKQVATEEYTFGANIKYLRERMGLSQAAFGKLIQQSEYSVYGFENRGALPSIVVAREMSILFGVSIDDLLFATLSDETPVKYRVAELKNESDVRVAWGQYRALCQQYCEGTSKNPCKGCRFEYEPDDCFVAFLGEELNK